MGKFELKNGARLAAAAGLGLTLALGAAPVVALAAESSANMEEVAQADTETVDVVEVSDASGLKDALSTSGTYKLTGDITLTEPLSIATGVDIVLDLNGKTVDGTSISSSSYIVSVEGALTVRDSSVQVEAPAHHDGRHNQHDQHDKANNPFHKLHCIWFIQNGRRRKNPAPATVVPLQSPKNGISSCPVWCGYGPACRRSSAKGPIRVSSPTPPGRRCRPANWASSRRSPSSRGRCCSPS